MNNHMERNPEESLDSFDSLLQKVVDGQLGEGDSVELNRLLEGSVKNQKRYFEYLELNEMILELRGVPGVATTVVSKMPTASQASSDSSSFGSLMGRGLVSISYGHLISGVVAFLLAANLFWMVKQDGMSQGSDFAITERSLAYENTPQLVGVTACEWHADSSPSVGSQFGFGEVVDLIEGIAEFEIHNKYGETARVFAEGPASIFVRSDGQLAAQNGLITAKAASSLHSFCIFTPNGSVHFAGGSNIGIEVSLVESRVHAFAGSVELNRGFGFGDSDLPVKIGTGESVHFGTTDGQVRLKYAAADKSPFGFMQSMSSDRLNLGREYRDAVVDSEPAIYWRFDGKSLINNEVSDRWTAMVRGGLTWKRYSDHVSAEFGAQSQSSLVLTNELWPEEPLDEYTVELWAKPSHYHNGAILGLCEPNTKNHGLLLEVGAPYHQFDYHTRPNRFRFLHRSPPGKADGESCYDDDMYKIRQWQHVVARKKGKELQLFIDGKLVGTEVENSSLPANLQLVVGQLDSHRMERAFVGQIDEIALYERALEDAEIQSHFKVAKTTKKSKDSEASSSFDKL